MTVKIFSNDIELIKIDEDSSKLEPANDGLADYQNNKVYFNGYDSYNVCIHELLHFYLYFVGLGQMENFEVEIMCDICAKFISNLILDNGDDILYRIKTFVERS